jgi:protein TonB
MAQIPQAFTPSRPMQIARFLPLPPSPRQALLAAIAGGVLGLLLFLLAWARLDAPSDTAVQPAAAADVPAPGNALPRPDTAGGAAPALQAADVAAPVPRAPTPPPPAQTPNAEASPAGEAGAAAGSNPLGNRTADPNVPLAIDRVAPAYPPAALRNGERGTVVVRISVGVDGTPVDVGIERSSRSRDLDRAALDAARRWRFRPAQSNGQPIRGDVLVPFEFAPPPP